MTMITSLQNEQIKQIKKLQKAKERRKQQQFILEGFHLVEEAVQSGWPLESVLFETGAKLPELPVGLNCIEVSRKVLEHLSETETPQGILAVAGMKETALPEQVNFVLVCDSVQDPGNLGTMIRTADAAGFDAVICGTGTVDPYNDKTIRATQGSLFHIPVMNGDLAEALPKLKSQGIQIWAAALEGAVDYDKAANSGKLAIIVGNEGAGISDEVLSLADTIVKIPIYGRAESLNVSVAAGILMYEAKK